MHEVLLITGGVRSGKSRYAEARIAAHAPPWAYIATAEARDEEMAERIRRHRNRRSRDWRTLEAPLGLTGALAESEDAGGRLVDCLTLWLSNLMEAERDIAVETEQLCDYLARTEAPVVLVTNEVGLGIVPENPLARRFRDAAGELNQRVAEVAGEVVLMVAGHPVPVKPA